MLTEGEVTAADELPTSSSAAAENAEEPPTKKSRHSPTEGGKPSLVMNLKLKDDQYERVEEGNSRPSTALGIEESTNDSGSRATPLDSSNANSTHGEDEEDEVGTLVAPLRDIRAASVAPDRARRTRGRRRARGGYVSTRPQRSSPDSDEDYDGGKRRRTAVSEDRTFDDPDGKHDSEKKRVPPLRISLNLKPSGEGDDSNLGDSGSSPRSHSSTPKPAQPSPPLGSGKRGGRTGRGAGGWGGNRKGDFDETAHGQRMTRSKVRQSGATLDDSVVSQRRGKGYRRGGLATSASSNNVATVVVTSTGDETASNSPLADQSVGTPDTELLSTAATEAGTREPSVDPLAQATLLDNVPAPLKLMYKTSYEGFKGMRSMIEEKWLRDALKPDIPNPKGFQDYLIYTRNYETSDDAHLSNGRIVNTHLFALPPDLKRLAEEQDERRQQLTAEHLTERNRLQLFAEREYLRLLKRDSSSAKPTLSAIRVVAEAAICNPMYVDDEERFPDPPTTIVKSQLVKKFDVMSREMRSRQRLESATLRSAQVRVWESSLKKYIDGNPSSKVTYSFPADLYVQEVEVKMLTFSFD
ncbi:hypothetical protein L596_008322 [Steinernema carpocapsae]|uniref:Uncharacterized protein n=1 Tax=Steinernema carpocapsae TaxID=34508 RepID=A0A4U5PD75_STECR|nr:hypothetical protein L596_008322 [Steinernema carpocapsae]